MEFLRNDLTDDQLIQLYKNLLWPRLIEEKMLVLLRQGRISKWFSGIGQEAISVGATMALQQDEWIMPLHRNLGVFTSRRCLFISSSSNGKGRRMVTVKAGSAVSTSVVLPIIFAA
jgi:TPP-dependent pyruvate/acetoin dehydrogenase alpha subunit